MSADQDPAQAADAHLREDRVASQTIYQGHFLRVMRDEVRLPDGRPAAREYVVHPGAVMIVPVLPDGRLVMERQFRYPVGMTMIEFPAGKLDAGEGGLACAQRELLEEFERASHKETSPESAGFFSRVKEFFEGKSG